MKNIHLIPTKKPSRLSKHIYFNTLVLTEDFFAESIGGYYPQHIYITSNEQPKHNDYYTTDGKEIYYCNTLNPTRNNHYKKVILTTDQDLIADGVQSIDDEFLEWFVKNPSCERVEVEKQMLCDYCGQEHCDNLRCRGYKDSPYYEIIIPQEDPKQETLELKRNYQKHSLTKTKGYKLWCNIIQRCYNPKNHSYKYYGEKGVVMEDYFKNSYENFIDWIKGIANYDKWLNSSELSLDRIDNTLGYIRGNIKFSTKTEQVENQNLRIDNKSGYKGVCYHKLNKKYGATITINKSKVFLGYYDTALEAALVYDNYVLKNNLNRKTNL
jgi:hypothetical protein